MTDPTEFEIGILRHLSGAQKPVHCWGAAVGEAIEWLHGAGYVDRVVRAGAITYTISDKGRALIPEAEREQLK